MTREEYIREVNSCFGCDCYDEDMGCTMPSVDRAYACSLESEVGGENGYDTKRD